MASKAERIFDLYQNNLRELSEFFALGGVAV